MFFSRLFSAAALACLAAVSAVDGLALDWKAKELSLKSEPLQRRLNTSFAFTNNGTHPVTIKHVESSCDCVSAKASSNDVAPGASGTIDVAFHIADRIGTYQRTILVRTDESDEPVALTLRLEIPEPAVLTPRVLNWPRQSSPAEQTVDVAVSPGLALKIDRLESTDATFQLSIETLEEGYHYRLRVKPQGTTTQASAALRIFTTTADGHTVVLNAYGNVR